MSAATQQLSIIKQILDSKAAEMKDKECVDGDTTFLEYLVEDDYLYKCLGYTDDAQPKSKKQRIEEDISVVHLQHTTTPWNFSQVNFQNAEFSKDEIRNIYKFATDLDVSKWEEIPNLCTSCTARVTTSDFNVYGKVAFQIIGTLPFDALRVVRSFYANETRQNMSSIVSTTQHLDYVHGVDCASTVIRQTSKLMFPFSEREFVTSNSCIYLPDKKQYFIAKKSTQSNNVEPWTKIVRASMIAGYIFEELSETTCKIMITVFTDFSGYIPNRLSNKIIRSLAETHFIILQKKLQDSQGKEFTDPSKLLDTLQENQTKNWNNLLSIT